MDIIIAELTRIDVAQWTPAERERRLHRLLTDYARMAVARNMTALSASGGVDSTYVAYVAESAFVRWPCISTTAGTRSSPSTTSKSSQEAEHRSLHPCARLGGIRDLQLSFLTASVSDAEIPTDHAIMATLYNVTKDRGLRYIVNGTNIATEGVLPVSWTYGVGDWRYISGVHRKFGTVELRTYPHFTRNDWLYYEFVLGIQSFPLLDCLPYVKSEAMDVLQNKLGWQYYGGKHYESIYTRFFQGYILPQKFGIDKRRAHLSTLICSGQITREGALEQLKDDPIQKRMMRDDRDYVIKKLGLTEAEFAGMMAAPIRTFRDYPTYRDRAATDAVRNVFLSIAKLGWRASRRVRGLSATRER